MAGNILLKENSESDKIKKMKNRKTIQYCLLAAALIFALMLGGCGRKNSFICPFSDVSWSVTPDKLVSDMGGPREVYASVYGGDTYVYDGDYLGNHGSVKYMFSEEGRLASMAWSLSDTDAAEIERIFNLINSSETKLRGENAFRSENDAANGSVWYLDSGDVLVSKISVNESSALQYAYILREYSKR